MIALGLLWMTQIDPGDSYLTAILPAVIVFGAGLTLVVAPVTATVLAAADTRHSGIASGVNNAVARVAGLLAVAVLPVVAGLTGDSFYNPAKMTHGFHVGDGRLRRPRRRAAAILAWLTIEATVLHAEPEPGGDTPERLGEDFSCGVGGPPLRPGREADCSPAATQAETQQRSRFQGPREGGPSATRRSPPASASRRASQSPARTFA